LAHPEAAPVIVTVLPMLAAAAGAEVAVIVGQLGVTLKSKALNASYVFGAVPCTPSPLLSRAQIENRYEPERLPAVLQLIDAFDE
jgi:hypothetical protein